VRTPDSDKKTDFADPICAFTADRVIWVFQTGTQINLSTGKQLSSVPAKTRKSQFVLCLI
jgi:hypothetical protein